MITKDNYIGIDEIIERLNTAPGYVCYGLLFFTTGKKVIDPSTITTIEGYVEYVASLPVEERTAILADFDAELKEMTLEMIAKQNEGASGGN